MDRRSWPWKKKSEKAAVLTDFVNAALPNSSDVEIEKDDSKKEKYIQIKMESYTYLTRLEDQVKSLSEKLILAESEITTKDDLVKQHAKVAEEAVSGWEKAEAETLALSQHLESVTLQKLTADERALHLDSALKECMKQVRNVKEEGEQKLHDTIFSRTKQWERLKAELESRINAFGQELQKASAENSVLSSSLQERSHLLKKISEEKSQADAQIEVLKIDLHSCEKEISSMKYELHVISKELEIRNEEKNMSMRSAEVAVKQHLEDIKKIAKLEAECQRLRGLVRKKLPGPAALAQMKLEVESLGRESGEVRLRKSASKSSSPHHLSLSDVALENIQQVYKENEFLAARLLNMEEEMKLLNEALLKRDNELQVSIDMFAKQADKLHSMETHALALSKQKSFSSSPGNESKLSSMTFLSQDDIGAELNLSDSCSTSLVSEFSHPKKDKGYDTINTAESSKYLNLMDDFLEMEKLACLPTKTEDRHSETDEVDTNSNKHRFANSKPLDLTEDDTVISKDLPLLTLKARIISIFESQALGSTVKQIIENIRFLIQDAHEGLLTEKSVINDFSEKKHFHTHFHKITDDGVSLNQDSITCTEVVCLFDQELKDAISHIYDFVLSLSRNGAEIQDYSKGLPMARNKIEAFSASKSDVLCNELSLHDFILSLSNILSETNDHGYKIQTQKGNEGESSGSDCIDKETLLENKVARLEENQSVVPSLVIPTSFSPDFEGPTCADFHLKTIFPMSLEDLNYLKLEKEKLEQDLNRCQEMRSQASISLVETEKQLSELNLELASCQNSNSLFATQLKCMAESYKILESQKELLEAEICRLHTDVENLDNELQVERHSHQEDMIKYKELQEQMDRNLKTSACASSTIADEKKTNQEIDIAAAAEKLADCQETIFLLSKQLQAMRNRTEPQNSPPNQRLRRDNLSAGETDTNNLNSPSFFSPQSSGHGSGESPSYGHNSQMSPPESESAGSFNKSPVSSNHQKQKNDRSSSSSHSPKPVSLSDKQGQGLTRFFSKGKIER